jgi:hypothetical protein
MSGVISVMLPKAKKGSVTINAKAGKLRIVLPRSIGDGKQHCIYTGFDDTAANRKKVQMVALQIELDIENNSLDCTLLPNLLQREKLQDTDRPTTAVTPSLACA